MATEEGSTLRRQGADHLHSIYSNESRESNTETVVDTVMDWVQEVRSSRQPVGTETNIRNAPDDPEVQNIRLTSRGGEGAPQAKEAKGLLSAGDGDVDDDFKEDEDLDESEPEPLTLPESTHTLFFTQPVCSYPFGFALSIVIISILCLSMALKNNLEDSSPNNPLNVPVNVSVPVRTAQYMAIFIVLIMEEEIPTGLYLLRMIPSSSFKKKFPNKKYKKFVFSAILRIVLGYIFLGNVFIILAQANGVLDIFYDVLSLQFIQGLDDIAFSLAKIDVFGKRLQRACTAKLFQTEFEKQKFGRSKKASIFLRSVYFLNFIAFLGGMIHISMRQTSGYYQCNSITVDFGSAVWGDAVVEVSPGEFEEWTLVFSTFNGVYKKNGTQAGRPVYQETRKFDRLPYDYAMVPLIVPAEIKYSEDVDAWVFTHSKIGKKRGDESRSWLLRSPETTEYDLLNVGSDWEIWVGVIGATQVSYSCEECNTETDCNLNGQCVSGACECNEEDETSYLGPHCEVKLKNSCRSIIDGVAPCAHT